MNVRPGTEADVPAAAAIDDSISTERVLVIEASGDGAEQTFSLRWVDAKPSGSRRQLVTSESYLREELAQAERFWVVESDGQVVGRVLVNRLDWHPTTGFLIDIAVDRQSRGRGAGTMLVETAKAWAIEAGLRGLLWEAQTDNEDAINFAMRHGFEFGGFNLFHYRNDDRERQLEADFRGLAVFLYWPAK